MMKPVIRCVPLLLAALQFTAQAADKPKLLLTIVIDQFRYDYLTRFRSEYRAGLARLLNEGAVFTDARYPQAPTVTAVGHSTVMSGAPPSLSGIIGNEWYDRTARARVTSVSDGNTRLLGADKDGPGSSPRRMLVSTLPDELKIAEKADKVIGISIKDRSAVLPAGHMADAAYWFDSSSKKFVTSTYYRYDTRAWVAAFNLRVPLSPYQHEKWKALDAKPEDPPFCFMSKDDGEPVCDFDATPYSNVMLEDFAENAIKEEDLGRHKHMDVLALSFSGNDYVGHAVGPDSPQVRDISIRTDRLIGKLLDFLDTQLGKGNTLVVLTADHGVAPVPEENVDRKMPGGRLNNAQIAKVLDAALAERFGKGDWILNSGGEVVYLNLDTMADRKVDPAEARRVAAQAARSIPHIARVFTRDQLENGEPAADRVGAAVLMGYYGARSGDLVLIPEPYYLFGAGGTGHSTPYGYDNHVPVIFWGPGIRHGVFHEPVRVNDIAPTLAALFEVETPSGSIGRVLSEIFR